MKYIIANWKMNPSSLKKAKILFQKIEKGLQGLDLLDKKIVICSPYLYLFNLINFKLTDGKPSTLLYNKKQILNFGAQNCFWEDNGAFTGEISPSQLKEIGVEYVILGHSERRRELGENYEIVSKKIKASLRNNLTPILCFGSNSMDINKEKQEIQEQIKTVFTNLSDLNDLSEKIIITYEPIWAISANKNSAPANAKRVQEIIYFIKNIIKSYNIQAKSYIYGGSVDSKNIKSFVNQDNNQNSISGVLVGGASLIFEEFIKIVKNV